MGTTRWKTDIIAWETISDKTAALMLEQSGAALKETVETAKMISARAEKLISILIPISSLLVVYFLNNIKSWNSFLPLSALLSLLFLGASIYFSAKNMFKYVISIPGELPETIITSKFIDNDFDDKEQYVNMVLNVCENIQERIDTNNRSNQIRLNDGSISLKILLWLPICPFLSALISQFLADCVSLPN